MPERKTSRQRGVPPFNVANQPDIKQFTGSRSVMDHGNREQAKGIFLFYLLSLLIGVVVSMLLPEASASIALLLFLLSHWGGYKYYPFSFVALLPIFLIRLLEMIAAVVLNTGVTLPELDTQSHPSNAFLWLSILYSFWPILTAWVLPKIIDVYEVQESGQIGLRRATLFSFSSLVIVYALMILGFYAIYGAPLFDDHGKYAFYSTAGSRLLNALVRYRLGMVCLVGYLMSVTRSTTLKLVLSLLYASLFILGADKLTAPILALGFGLMPSLVLRDPTAIFKPKVLLTAFLIVGMAGSVYIGGRIALAKSSDAALDSIMLRLPAQSQMWYIVSEGDPPLFNLPSMQTKQELLSMLPLGDSPDRLVLLGQSKALEDLAGVKAYKNLSSGGASFIMILYPYVMKYYGVLTLVAFNFALIAYYNLIFRSFMKSIGDRRPFLMLVFALILQSVATALVTGNLSTILSTNIYVLYAVIAAIYMGRQILRHHRV